MFACAPLMKLETAEPVLSPKKKRERAESVQVLLGGSQVFTCAPSMRLDTAESRALDQSPSGTPSDSVATAGFTWFSMSQFRPANHYACKKALSLHKSDDDNEGCMHKEPFVVVSSCAQDQRLLRPQANSTCFLQLGNQALVAFRLSGCSNTAAEAMSSDLYGICLSDTQVIHTGVGRPTCNDGADGAAARAAQNLDCDYFGFLGHPHGPPRGYGRHMRAVPVTV